MISDKQPCTTLVLMTLIFFTPATSYEIFSMMKTSQYLVHTFTLWKKPVHTCMNSCTCIYVMQVYDPGAYLYSCTCIYICGTCCYSYLIMLREVFMCWLLKLVLFACISLSTEPGILLMQHSMRAHPQITVSLLDFLCRVSFKENQYTCTYMYVRL